jgi:prepilin-type N-terminal cleavage/methylation domain-containing protein
MKSKTAPRAFTLIELLIVVAIIAILAAIAVPNFLEAQVRAKVSRSKADMRSICLAVEAYAVDGNHYPLIPDWPKPGWDDVRYWLVPLTTPTAYITSLPRYPWKAYRYMLWSTMKEVDVDYYYYNARESFESDLPGALPWSIWDPRDQSRWYLSAAGPDHDLDQKWTSDPGSNHNLYDPTNGTVSSGDIIRVGP